VELDEISEKVRGPTVKFTQLKILNHSGIWHTVNVRILTCYHRNDLSIKYEDRSRGNYK
jgi:hypothetical protein